MATSCLWIWIETFRCAMVVWSSWCWGTLSVAHHHCHCINSSSPTLSCALFPVPLRTPICTNYLNCKVSPSLPFAVLCELSLHNGSYTDDLHQHFTRSLKLSVSLHVPSILNTTHLWQKVVALSSPLSHGGHMNLSHRRTLTSKNTSGSYHGAYEQRSM